MNISSTSHKHKRTQKITGIVIHTAVGTYAGTLSWFKNNSSLVSSHYLVKEDGSEVTQIVTDDYVAYHAGTVSKPTTPVYRGGNPNEYTIGIECADNKKPADFDRSQQLPTLIKLVADLCKKHNIPCDRNNICGHKEIRSTKTCPGNIDVDYVVREAQKILLLMQKTYTEEEMTSMRQQRDNNWNLYQDILQIQTETRKEKEIVAEDLKKEKEARQNDLERIAIILNVPPQLGKIIPAVETAITFEDKANKLEKKLEEERTTYAKNVSDLKETLEDIKKKLNDAEQEIDRLKLEKPEPTTTQPKTSFFTWLLRLFK